jgi:hypothetical protein
MPKHDSITLMRCSYLLVDNVKPLYASQSRQKFGVNCQVDAWKQLCRTSSGCLLTSFLSAQLLTEMDGFDSEEGVLVLAATNRAEVQNRLLVTPITCNSPWWMDCSAGFKFDMCRRE